jgi:hypothetical protein
MQGLDLVCKLFVGRGDLVAVESPTYTNGTATISGYEGEMVEVPGDAGGMDVGALSFGSTTDQGLLWSDTTAGSTLGVYRPGTSTFLLADPDDPSMAAATTVAFGRPGDQGLVGAWGWSHGDGSDRVGVFRPSTAQWFLADTPTPNTGGTAAPITSVTSFTFGDPGDTALACDPEH